MILDRYNQSEREMLRISLWGTLFEKNEKGKTRLSWRGWRWLSIIIINLLFFLSFFVDIQILEGTLNGSRLFGFHLIDIFTGIEIFAATHHIHTNVIIGTVTLLIFYMLAGGKAYCGWVCPYGLLSEIGEHIHMKLLRKK
jgi:ferredoxin-type protein NapH